MMGSLTSWQPVHVSPISSEVLVASRSSPLMLGPFIAIRMPSGERKKAPIRRNCGSLNVALDITTSKM